MRKNILLFIAVLSLGLGMAPRADAASSNPADDSVSVVSHSLTDDAATRKYYQANAVATVVSNQGDALVVYLNEPEALSMRDGDQVPNLLSLPMTAETTTTGPKGGAVDTDTILPGQGVQVSFRFYWQSGNPRVLTPDRCIAVQLRGEVRTKKSTATTDTFKKDVLVGTVLTNKDNQLTVYVESGKVFYGDTEYLVRGMQRAVITSQTSLVDSRGKAVSLSSIAPLQRVLLVAGENLWMESYPPQYSLQNVSRVRVLDDGEYIISPRELAQSSRVTCKVLRVEKTAQGGVQLVVQPVTGSRERKFSAEYTVPHIMDIDQVYAANGSAAAFSSIKAGMTLKIWYNGLVYGDGQGQIPWYNRIDILA